MSKEGYLGVQLSILKKNRHFYIHKLVATAFIPNPDNLECVGHLDGNRKNNKDIKIEIEIKIEMMTSYVKTRG